MLCLFVSVWFCVSEKKAKYSIVFACVVKTVLFPSLSFLLSPSKENRTEKESKQPRQGWEGGCCPLMVPEANNQEESG